MVGESKGKFKDFSLDFKSDFSATPFTVTISALLRLIISHHNQEMLLKSFLKMD